LNKKNQENISHKKEFLKEILKMEICMVMANTFFQMEIFIQDNLVMAKQPI
jgi:hypothetical protein